MTDSANIESRIAQLRIDAQTHGDPEMATLCADALNGDASALDECIDALKNAEAMAA